MVSVCIATYNGEKYIREQLASILKQLSSEDEIIISDDSSTDNTVNILRSYNDKRIKIFPNNHFYSPIYNFENAIKHASGNYIFLADQDDIWLPNKVSRMYAKLKDFDLVISDCKIVDDKLNIIHESFFELYSSRPGFLKNLYKNSYIGCCIAFRREILNYILPFPNKIAMHDSWIGLSVELHGSVYFLEEPLLLYRRHGNNASYSGEKSQLSITFRIKYRIELFYNLIIRKYF